MPKIEAVLLTGGASTRMGADKASLIVDGEPLAKLIAKRLLATGCPVTVCGLEPIDGCSFLRDATDHEGPLAALAAFEPKLDFVFVAACDLPCFDPLIGAVMAKVIGTNDAAIAKVGGRLQPLAALYAARAFPVAKKLLENGKRSMAAWLEQLDVRTLDESELDAHAIDIESVQGANTSEELERLVSLKAERPIRYFDALFRLFSHAPMTQFEVVPISQLAGRILGEAILARRDHPPYDASAVDGFAVSGADIEKLQSDRIELVCAGTLGPGEAAELAATPGQTVRVLTGAPLPPGTAAIVMREQAKADGAAVQLHGPATKGDHIRRRAEEFLRGDVIVPAGVRAHAGVVAAAAMTGKVDWLVGVSPTVALVVTGDELVPVGAEADDRTVFDSHTAALTAALRQIGIEPIYVARSGDSETATREALLAALGVATVVLTTGGVSGGDRDYIRRAIATCDLGEIFAGVRIRPGRPVVFAATRSTPRKYVFGLPGNPMAALVAFEVLVKPFLRAASGLTNVVPELFTAKLASAIHKRPGVSEFVPVTLAWVGGTLLATPLEGRRSHMFGGLALANGLARLHEPDFVVEAGSPVSVSRWGD